MSLSPPRDEERRSRSPATPPTATERSIAVLARASFKLAFFVLAAGAQAVAGYGFVRPLASLVLIAAILAVILGHWRVEQATAPHYTAFDEAAWFLLLGFVLRHLE